MSDDEHESLVESYDEEDEEDLEEYEDEEEDGFKVGGGNQKKFKSKTDNIFEDEAEIDEDDDEEDEDDEDADDDFEEHYGSNQKEKDQRAYNALRSNNNYNYDEVLSKFEQKYANQDSDHEEYEEYEEEDIPKQSYWRLKCRLGEEKMFVASMMQKMLNNQRGPPADRILVKSMMAPQHLPGHVYVEAEREVHVRNAIKGVTSLVSFTPILTPLKDIIEILSANKKNVDLQKGSWVRIKLGKYKADIGQIVSSDSSRSRITVKLIPRLDLPAIAQSIKDKEDKDSQGDKNKSGKRKRTRPQARFFNPDEVEKLKIPLTRQTTASHGVLFVMNNEKYKDGFLYKIFRTQSVIVDGVVPSLEELQKFQDREEKQLDEDGNPMLDVPAELSSAPILPRILPKANHFSKGDTVRVAQGDLKNLMAIVESVEDDKVLIVPLDQNIKDTFAFKPYELQKYFKVGDHVKAIGGRYEGETGMVLRVDELQVVLLSDLTMTEIKVKPQDLQECTEVATGRLELGNYELHDLVQIGPHKVGVITKVERDSFKILDEGGNVSTVKLQEVGSKRRNKSFTTLDTHHNTIQSGDLIEVVDGSYKGKQGTILHISRNFLFIKSKDVFENGGVFVVRTQYCSLLGGNKNKQNNIQQQQQQNQSQRGGFGGGRGGGRGGHGGGRGRREDSPLHKVVTIKSGPWKGYVGIVKECTETMVQVELQTNSKRINVMRANILLPHERAQQPISNNSDWEFNVGRTPMREDPSQTPMRMNTPARSNNHDPWAMRESSDYYSSSSSSNNSMNNNDDTTPGTNYSLYSPYTPTTPLDGNRHGESTYTPYDRSTPMGSYSHNYDNPTPSYLSNYSDHTPHEIPSSPYTPHNIPQTPATPNSGEDHDEEVEQPFWSGTNIEVIYKDNGKHAVVLANTTESTCKIEILDTKEVFDNVHQSQLTLVSPLKKDHVVIIKGKLTGYTGTLFILTEENTGIIKMDSNYDFKVFKMSYFGKLIR
ncbi:hypothetical protein DICPUDRAFT_47274 [Dictyostelium purpureum]|uniref:Transcription elongation factor SPT5 n=1 Tax=Dictyostelium purpureum TaxID=5786 RepID=F0ZIM6_DICPU|nr:uncharacterized protein DICPUDRAFT_47274 [Dictyostelium purpureum]EGC36193.1 hypothetical protein DICPUDRAFT_47274 [Dictyostelium purpureum]|eukprot:XP_003287260.1 hypothetical protein DICPUDRAFT_47274 [Dictyostelium purpureum]